MGDDQLAAALEAIDAATGEPSENSALMRAKCRGLMRGYHERWRTADMVSTSVEATLTAPLPNIATGKTSRTFTIAGKLDVTVLIDGRRNYIIDHKTTSQDINDANAPYWRQLAVEGQATHYLLLAWLNGQKYDGALWDVVRKPGISPKKLTKAERAAVVSSRSYFNQPLSAADLERLQVEERESPEMYESRLAHDCTHERPEWYFQRRSVPRLDHEMEEYAGELWDIAQDIVQVRRTGKHYRNSGACLLYGSPCEYLGICSHHDSETSERWKLRGQVHAELPLEGDGRDVLTNSRLRCFQTCRRKEYFRYELGIERVDAEEREALYFGHAWHAGQEAWWSCLLIPEELSNGNADSDSRTNAARKSVAAPELAR